ncbi:hypothetical protein CSW10_02895 [Mesomycoplasma dispar]|uniref:Gcp-like domain-containing protein n=1 Tax=Mesomycoplasma dispar TaxID=86660 RepID=A0ABN5DVK5_9BACT|nr:hypothetical protein CSW10_02895 [Mesomycoplasma dispar]
MCNFVIDFSAKIEKSCTKLIKNLVSFYSYILQKILLKLFQIEKMSYFIVSFGFRPGFPSFNGIINVDDLKNCGIPDCFLHLPAKISVSIRFNFYIIILKERANILALHNKLENWKYIANSVIFQTATKKTKILGKKLKRKN